jgi:hypothetical protein
LTGNAATLVDVRQFVEWTYLSGRGAGGEDIGEIGFTSLNPPAQSPEAWR